MPVRKVKINKRERRHWRYGRVGESCKGDEIISRKRERGENEPN